MVYLSNQILFVILVAVLIVGGSSKLMFWEIEEGWRDGLGDDDDADAAERSKKCLSGCTRATLPSGNCKWLPEKVPRSQQRYICPHTCQKDSAESDKVVCKDDTDCSKCTPQTDYTARTYSGTQIKKGTGGACAISKPCSYKPNAKVLNICNPHDSPNNGANNLVCLNKSSTNDPSEAKWVDIDTAVNLLPSYTPDQIALVTCDINEACSTEGERCTDSTGNRVICQNNLWLKDPKYSSESTARHGPYDDHHGGGDRYGDDGDGDGDGGHGHGYRAGNEIIDNYYTVNHFYGVSAATATPATAATTAAPATAATAATTSPILSTPPPSNNYGVSAGSTTVPLIGPKGQVATVQAYESSIRF